MYGHLEKTGWQDVNTNFFYHPELKLNFWKWDSWTLEVPEKSNSLPMVLAENIRTVDELEYAIGKYKNTFLTI